MNQKLLHIEGMICMDCVRHVEKKLKSIQGVSVEVSLENKWAIVTSMNTLDENILKEKVKEAGYTVIQIKPYES